MDERPMTTDELSEYLGVPVSTIYVWNMKGTGPKGYRVGKYVRYFRSDVNKWITEQPVNHRQTA